MRIMQDFYIPGFGACGTFRVMTGKIRKAWKYLFISGLATLWGFPCFGAVPEVEVSLRPDSIMIGDHVTLRVEVRKDMMQVVDFPAFEMMKLQDDIVFIKELPVDTIETEGRRQLLVKEYILTSFRAGGYRLGEVPVLYIDKNVTDTLKSGSDLSLLVNTFEIDTLNNTIYDIKRPEEAPMMINEVRGYVVGGILLACLLASVIWLVARSVARRKSGASDTPRPRVMPHVKAIRELEQLNNQKLWQNSKHKSYYTRLTDIIREYLEGRYGIGAMEMTTDEIISAMSDMDLQDKSMKNLVGMLRTADLVKFAKFTPDADYNEKVYYDAYYFVEDTKEVPEEIKESEITNIEPENVSGNE